MIEKHKLCRQLCLIRIVSFFGCATSLKGALDLHFAGSLRGKNGVVYRVLQLHLDKSTDIKKSSLNSIYKQIFFLIEN